MTNWLKIEAPIGETFSVPTQNAGPVIIQAANTPDGSDPKFVRTYATCAAVRADLANALTYSAILVTARGTFTRSTNAGTDTTNELTSYIGTSGNGFEFVPVSYTDFAYNGTPTFLSGRTFWDGDSWNICTDIAGVIIQVGEEEQILTYNPAATTIANGSTVYASGATGQRLNIDKFADGTSVLGWQFLGLITHDGLARSNCRVTTFGQVRDLNTNGLNIAKPVYTTSTLGVWSQTLPPGTEEAWEIGLLTQAHPNQGSILVRPRYLPRLAGTTANRPTTVRVGEIYFDQTLNKPIWRVAAGWVDATGASV